MTFYLICRLGRSYTPWGQSPRSLLLDVVASNDQDARDLWLITRWQLTKQTTVKHQSTIRLPSTKTVDYYIVIDLMYSATRLQLNHVNYLIDCYLAVDIGHAIATQCSRFNVVDCLLAFNLVTNSCLSVVN